MNKSFILMLAGLAAGTLTLPAATLSLGDPAPALKVSRWVKGEPVTGFESNKTYVVEFWAIWCPSCRANIPHMTALAHKFKEVPFIGLDAWEKGRSTDEAVTKFVAKQGDKQDYLVARDTADDFMALNWMKAAEQGGIPAAFIVQQNRVMWIGAPEDLEQPLSELLTGKFDLAKAKMRLAGQMQEEAFYKKAVKGGDEAALLKEGAALEALDKQLGGIDPGETFDLQKVLHQARFEATVKAYQKALEQGQTGDELAQLEVAARALTPTGKKFDDLKQQVLDNLAGEQAQALFRDYAKAVGDPGDAAQAAELGKQLEALHLKSASLLNKLAWTILTGEQIKHRDLPLATRLAKAGVDVSGAKESAILDTYAHALFDSGRVAEAVTFQKQAVATAPDEDSKDDLADTLKKYEAAAKTE